MLGISKQIDQASFQVRDLGLDQILDTATADDMWTVQLSGLFAFYSYIVGILADWADLELVTGHLGLPITSW